MGFNAEQPLLSEGGETKRSPENIARRTQRLSDYVSRIERAGQDFYFKQERRPHSLDDRNLAKGVNAALMALAAAGATGWSFLKRGENGFWGHSIAAGGTFFGMQLFGHKGMEFVQHFLKVPRTKLDTWRNKRNISLRDEEYEKEARFSEHSLRGNMLALQLELQEVYANIRVDVREYREEKEQIQEKARIDLQTQPQRELQYERLRFLRKRLLHIDQLIAKQENLLGTMKDYHDLSRFHEEKRSWAPLGFASVGAFLAGVHASARIDMQALQGTGEKIANIFSTLFQTTPHQGKGMDFQTSSSLAPTFMAMLMGWYVTYLKHSSGHERNRDAQKILERIEEEIQGVKTYRAGLMQRLSRLRGHLGLESADEIEKTFEDTTQQGKDASYEQWLKRFDEVIGLQFTERQSIVREQPSYGETADTRFAPTLNELLAPVSSESIVSAESTSQSTRPLTLSKLERIYRPNVPQRIVAHAFGVIGHSSDIEPPEFFREVKTVELSREEVLHAVKIAVARPDISTEDLEKVVACLNEQEEELGGEKSLVVYLGEHAETFFEAAKIVQDVYHARRQEEVRNALQKTPGLFRAFVLSRYGIRSVKIGEEVDENYFQQAIRDWVIISPDVKKQGRFLENFLNSCLDEIDTVLDSSQFIQKESIARAVRQALRILDDQRTESPVPDLAMQQRRRDVLARVATVYTEILAKVNKNDLVPERLVGFPFVRSDNRYASMQDVTIHPNDFEEVGVLKVKTRAIIGSFVVRDHWYIPSEREAIRNLMRPLIEHPSADAIEDFSFSGKRGAPNIMLFQFSGIYGSVYFAMMGETYIAAAKAMELPDVFATVKRVREALPIESLYLNLQTRNPALFSTWKTLNRVGLIDADIGDFDPMRSNRIAIKKNQLSLLPFFPKERITEICRAINEAYKGGLDKITTTSGKKIFLSTHEHHPLLSDTGFKEFTTDRKEMA